MIDILTVCDFYLIHIAEKSNVMKCGQTHKKLIEFGLLNGSPSSPHPFKTDTCNSYLHTVVTSQVRIINLTLGWYWCIFVLLKHQFLVLNILDITYNAVVKIASTRLVIFNTIFKSFFLANWSNSFPSQFST